MSDDRTGYGPVPPTPGSTGGPGTPPGPVPPSAPGPQGQPGPHGPQDRPGRQGLDSFFAAIRRIGVVRTSDRWVGGVAGGLARRFDLDPLLVRGVVGVTMLMGFGFVLYGVAWALLPEESDGRIHLEQTLRGWFDIALLGAIGMIVLGASAGDWWFGWGPFNSGWFPAVAWTAAAVAIVAIIANARRGDGAPRPPQQPWTPPTEGRSTMPAPGQAQPTRPAQPTSAAQPASPVQPAGAPAPTVHAAVPPQPAPGPAYGGPTAQRPAGPAGPVPPYGGAPGAGHGGPVPPPPGRGWTPQPPVPPKPPKPPKPIVRGPGGTLTGVVVGLILLGLAGLMIADRTGHYEGPIAAVVLGGGVVLVGLAIIVSGLRGRSSGGLTALAIIGVIAALPAAANANGSWWDNADRRAFSDEDIVVTSREAAEAGYSFGIGDATIDLTQVPLTDETLSVAISGGLGDITVIVPDDIAVSADVSMGGGDVKWQVDERERSAGGFGHERTFTSDEMRNGRDAQIALNVDLGLGSITIEED
jgi:phage shock protein PspC (stress-responsive transcriptional regulator)